MRLILSFIAGALFGTGLYLSGMTDTDKVQGWLDIFGDWDPTLAFVMGGAILPMAIAWRVTRRARAPLVGGAFPAPADPEVDHRLDPLWHGLGLVRAVSRPGGRLSQLWRNRGRRLSHRDAGGHVPCSGRQAAAGQGITSRISLSHADTSGHPPLFRFAPDRA